VKNGPDKENGRHISPPQRQPGRNNSDGGTKFASTKGLFDGNKQEKGLKNCPGHQKNNLGEGNGMRVKGRGALRKKKSLKNISKR